MPALSLEAPGLVLLLGPTGSGKTTLLRSATRLLPVLGLHVTGDFSTDPEGLRVAYLPQDAHDAFLSFEPEQELSLRARAAGRTRREAEELARARLASLELVDQARTPIHRLSAGERKRLALEAILTNDPQALLLDEPFNHLDAEWRARIAKAILTLADRRLVLLATHDPRPWLPAAKRVLVVRGGLIAFDGNRQEIEARAGEFPELRLTAETVTSPAAPREGETRVRLDRVEYAVEGRPVLRGATANFGPGLHALVGDNGSGKTTLLRMMAGLVRPNAGTLDIGSAPSDRPRPQAMCRRLSMLTEEPTKAFFAPTVRQEVVFQLVNQRVTGCDVNARFREVSSDFELEGMESRSPLSLSGGEKEGVALASVDAARTPVILLDEPTLGLDAQRRTLLFAFLARASARACVIVATHDEALVARAHTVHRIQEGQVRPLAREVLERTPS